MVVVASLAHCWSASFPAPIPWGSNPQLVRHACHKSHLNMTSLSGPSCQYCLQYPFSWSSVAQHSDTVVGAAVAVADDRNVFILVLNLSSLPPRILGTRTIRASLT